MRQEIQYRPDVPIDLIHRNTKQPRKIFNQESLQDLATSIKQLGVIQPLVLRLMDGGEGFEIVAGERRWRAAQLAGLDSLPAIVRQGLDDLDVIKMAMVENMQREELNPLEEAAGYQVMIEQFALTHEAVAQLCGSTGQVRVRRDRVTRLLRLFQLPAEVQSLVASKQLPFTHAELLLTKEVQRYPGMAIKLALKAVDEDLSRRQLTSLIKRLDVDAEQRKKAPVKDGDWARLEKRYSEYLGSPMQINRKGDKYQLLIDCENLDIVEGVLEKFNLPDDY